MSIQTKIDTIIKSVGSINIQDFVEISNFDKDLGFYNKPNIEKIGRDVLTRDRCRGREMARRVAAWVVVCAVGAAALARAVAHVDQRKKQMRTVARLDGAPRRSEGS